MNLEIEPDLERRWQEIAQRRSQSITELVEEAMSTYVNAIENDPTGWVKTTQSFLPRIWPAEDFTDWTPPDGR